MLKITKIKIHNFLSFIGKKSIILSAIATLIGIATFAIESMFVFVLQFFLVALGLLSKDQTMLPSFIQTSILGSVLLLITFGVARSIIYMMKDYCSGLTTQVFIKNQRINILNNSIEQANIHSLHKIITLLGDNLQQASYYVIQGCINLIIGVTSTFLLIIFAVKIAPYELIISLTILVIFILPLKYFNTRIVFYGNQITCGVEKINQIAIRAYKNSFILKAYGLLDKELLLGEKAIIDTEYVYKKYYQASVIKNGIPMMVGTIIISISMYLGLNYFHTPSSKLLSFFYLFIRIAQSCGLLSTTVASIRLHFISLKILYRWHQKHVKSTTSKAMLVQLEPTEAINEISKIELQNISFSYDANHPILIDLNLQINKGELLLIHGPSGSGKSTILALLLGLIKPQKGDIKINCTPIELFSRQVVANHIAYVGPEPYLIPGTVRENMLYAHHNGFTVTDELIFESLEKAEVKDTILNLKSKLDEELNELTQLSTGQKQRLAIAKALLRHPKILILDEATANLDSETESAIITNLQKIMKDFIIIVVSHKDSFNKIANKTITLASK